MKHALNRILITTAALCLVGCLPEERFWWSPQGDRAIVSVDGGLQLTTTEGGLSPLPVKFSKDDVLPTTVSWLPDGSGFVCQRTRRVASWEEVKTLIPAEEVESVDALMPAVMPLVEAAGKMAGEREALEAVVKALPVTGMQRFGLALHRAFQNDPDAIQRVVRSLPEGEAMLAELRKNATGFDLQEVVLFRLATPNAAPVSLLRSLFQPLLLPKVSPTESFVAILRADHDADTADLHVVPLNGGPSQLIAHHVSGAYDWTPDGRTLVFMAPLGGEGEKLQSIHRLTVIEENGSLAKLGKPITLATAITLNRPVVQVLADGRVLFASQPVTLPATGTGPELAPRLYLIAADGSTVTPVPTALGDLPVNLGFFIASPDGKRVAVVESETDAVAVVEIDTGKTQIISPPHPRWQCRTMPAWKSATELTFAALHDGAPAWMLWREGEPLHCISRSWSNSSTAKWLAKTTDEPKTESVNAKPDPAR